MNVKIIRSNRKTLAIQINPDLSVTVRAPMYAPQSDIERILREKEGWIQKHIEKIREQEAKRKKTQGEKDEYGESVESEYLTNEEIKKTCRQSLAAHSEASKLLCKADRCYIWKNNNSQSKDKMGKL